MAGHPRRPSVIHDRGDRIPQVLSRLRKPALPLLKTMLILCQPSVPGLDHSPYFIGSGTTGTASNAHVLKWFLPFVGAYFHLKDRLGR